MKGEMNNKNKKEIWKKTENINKKRNSRNTIFRKMKEDISLTTRTKYLKRNARE